MLRHNTTRTRFVCALVCVTLTLGLAGCGRGAPLAHAAPSAPSQPVTPAPSAPMDTVASATKGDTSNPPPSTGMANPMVEYPNWRALENALDDVFEGNMAAPPHAQDITYYTLTGNIAQINFTLYGISYTLRGASTAQDIAGVYGETTDLGSFYVVSDDEMTTVNATTTADIAVFRWSWDNDAYYTLIAHAPEQDVTQYMDVDVTKLPMAQGSLPVYYPAAPRNNAEVARLCAELSSDESDVDDTQELQEYVRKTRNTHGVMLFPQQANAFSVMGTSVQTREACISASDGKADAYCLRSTVVDTSGEKITWQEFMRRHESAVLVETLYSMQSFDAGKCYQLMMPAANEGYCIIAAAFTR